MPNGSFFRSGRSMIRRIFARRPRSTLPEVGSPGRSSFPRLRRRSFYAMKPHASHRRARLRKPPLGLGSVWICKFDPVVLKKGFGMPEALEPVNILAVGYSDDIVKAPDRHDTERKAADELVTFI